MMVHQPKVVNINGFMLGACVRGICKCGWVGKLYPISTKGRETAVNGATMECHAHATATSVVKEPEFMVHLNEDPYHLAEEPKCP